MEPEAPKAPPALTLRFRAEEMALLKHYFAVLRAAFEDESGPPPLDDGSGDTLLPLLPYVTGERAAWDYLLNLMRVHHARHPTTESLPPMQEASNLDIFSPFQIFRLLRLVEIYDAPLLHRALWRPCLLSLNVREVAFKVEKRVFGSVLALQEAIRWDGIRQRLNSVYQRAVDDLSPLRSSAFVQTTTDKKQLIVLQAHRDLVVCGYAHTMVLASDGLYAFGGNALGQLGLGPTAGILVAQPTLVPGVSRIVAVACGAFHTLALDACGRVFGCGQDRDGQLGGVSGTNAGQMVTTMTRIPLPEDAFAWQVSCGTYHSAVLTDRGLYVMGGGLAGQLGLGQLVQGFAGRGQPTLLNTPGTAYRVTCGPQCTFVLTSNGVFACGANTHGQLGVGHTNPCWSLSRVQGHALNVNGASAISRICASQHHTLILSRDGTLYGCGRTGNNLLLHINFGGQQPMAAYLAMPVAINDRLQRQVLWMWIGPSASFATSCAGDMKNMSFHSGGLQYKPVNDAIFGFPWVEADLPVDIISVVPTRRLVGMAILQDPVANGDSRHCFFNSSHYLYCFKPASITALLAQQRQVDYADALAILGITLDRVQETRDDQFNRLPDIRMHQWIEPSDSSIKEVVPTKSTTLGTAVDQPQRHRVCTMCESRAHLREVPLRRYAFCTPQCYKAFLDAL